MISSAHKAIFLHVPKSAGTSIEHTFGQEGIAGSEDGAPTFMGEMYHKHWGLNQIKRFLNDRGRIDIYEDFFKFTFVRNPFGLIRSWYDFHKTRLWYSLPDTFEEFVLRGEFDEEVFQKQYAFDLFEGKQVGGEVDFVGRFENLEKDFQLVSRITGVNCKLPRVNYLGNKTPYWVDYTYEMRDTMEKVFKEDFETFNYCF